MRYGSLSWNKLGPEGGKAIGDALRVSEALTSLDVCSNGITGDAARDLVEETCWVTMAIRDSLAFTGVVNDHAAAKVNYKARANWMTSGDVYAALMAHPMAAAHRHKAWDEVWKEVKSKSARMRTAWVKDKMLDGKKGNFFGVAKAPPPAAEEKQAYGFLGSGGAAM